MTTRHQVTRHQVITHLITTHQVITHQAGTTRRQAITHRNITRRQRGLITTLQLIIRQITIRQVTQHQLITLLMTQVTRRQVTIHRHILTRHPRVVIPTRRHPEATLIPLPAVVIRTLHLLMAPRHMRTRRQILTALRHMELQVMAPLLMAHQPMKRLPTVHHLAHEAGLQV